MFPRRFLEFMLKRKHEKDLKEQLVKPIKRVKPPAPRKEIKLPPELSRRGFKLIDLDELDARYDRTNEERESLEPYQEGKFEESITGEDVPKAKLEEFDDWPAHKYERGD